MDIKDLQKKSLVELQKMLAEARATLYDTRLKMSVNQVRDVRKVRRTRAQVARILTCIKEKETEVK